MTGPAYSSADALLDEILAASPPLPDPTPSTAGEGPVVTRFDNPTDWVDQVYAVLAAGRRLPWCARWWEHPAALERLVWLWQSWEAAMRRQHSDPAAMSDWLRADFDYHRGVLQAADGPFAECTAGHTPPAPPLPATDRHTTGHSPDDAAVAFFTRTRQLPDGAVVDPRTGLAGLHLR
jgi:hypothetical protein